MGMTPEQRRFEVYRIAEADREYQKAKEQLDSEQARFTQFVDKLPKFLRNILWGYPGMLYLTYHRLLDVICEQMIFPDE